MAKNSQSLLSSSYKPYNVILYIFNCVNLVLVTKNFTATKEAKDYLLSSSSASYVYF